MSENDRLTRLMLDNGGHWPNVAKVLLAKCDALEASERELKRLVESQHAYYKERELRQDGMADLILQRDQLRAENAELQATVATLRAVRGVTESPGPSRSD